MSTERDVNRIVRSWLDEGVNVLPDRVLDAVLDQLPATPQRRASWLARRFPIMNSRIVGVGLIAAALVVAAIFGATVLGRPSVGPPAPTSSAAPTATALPTAAAVSPCTLITAEEAAQALHPSGPLTADDLGLSPARACFYRLPGGTNLFKFTYDITGGAAAFAAQKSGSGAQGVPGLGEDATWLPAGVLVIVKGDREVQITILDFSLDAATRLEESKAVGAIIAGRM